MTVLDKIKENQEIEKYFIDYIKCSYSLQTLPKEPPKNISKKELAKAGVIISNYDKARNSLLVELHLRYDTEIQTNKLNINSVVIEGSEYFENKYGEATLLKMPGNNPATAPNAVEPFKNMLKIQIKNCEICKTPRLELTYEQLPAEQKYRFEAGDENYYLFCPHCNNFTVVY